MKIQILRKQDVRKMTGIGATTLDSLEADGKFPKRCQITDRIVGWVEAEVQDFLAVKHAGGKWDQAGMESRLN